MKYVCVMLLGMVAWIAGAALHAAEDGSTVGVQVIVPLAPETVEQPADSQETALAVVSGEGAKLVALSLRPVADTHLWKESEKPAGNSATIVLRDNRWSQGLIRFDVSSVELPVAKAMFRFKAGKPERPGNGRLTFHRMLADWAENATWTKPFPDRAETWNGLKSGRDYDAAPFATYAVEDWKAPAMIEVPGFEKAVSAWRDGTWQNHGCLVLFSGKALQVGIPSRETKSPAPVVMALGGPHARNAVLHVDLPLMRRLLPAGGDLLRASLQVQTRLKGKPRPAADAALKLYKPKGGGGFEAAPFACAQISQADGDGRVSFAGLEDLVRGSLDDAADLPLLLAADGMGNATLDVYGAAAGEGRRPAICATVKPYPRAELLDFPLKPRDGVYCTMKDGHLFYGNQRLRLWGTVGYGAVERKRKMGFNCSRMWETPDLYDKESVKHGVPKAAADAKPDAFDVELADTRKQGMFVMYTGLTSAIPLEKYRTPLLAEDSFLAGGEDWPAWKAAVSGKIDQARLTVIDERLEKLRLAHATNLLNHRSPITGKRLGEEEAIVIYEVWNELGFVRWALEGGLEKSPAYFRDKAQAKWNAWLLKQYGDEASIRKAWGRIEDGESLAVGRIKLAPSLADRSKYPDARGRDIMRFWIELLDGFNQRFREHCRSQAPNGIGVNVVPFSFDTQYRPSVQWDYCKALGDVNCFGMYFWGIGQELAKPPSMYVMDSHAVADHPTVIYENNQARPCAWRAAYPQRVAALACWQDWDGVIFHYWGGYPNPATPDESYLLAALPHVNRSHYWSGVQHAFDPVMCSSMAMAGRMFTQEATKPASNPAAVDVGRQGIFSFDTYNGIGLGYLAFTRGARLRFIADKDAGVSLDGQPLAEQPRPAGAVRTGDGIIWDWLNNRMIIDTPTYKAYVGRTAGAYRFRDGLALSDVNVPWVCFTVASDDGRPLVGRDASRRMLVAAVFDAKNKGFEIDPSFTVGGPFEIADAIRNRGTAPIIVDKIGYTLSFPTEITGRFHAYDFALRKLGERTISLGNRLACEPAEIFRGVLLIDARGAAASTPGTTLPIADVSAAPAATAPAIATASTSPAGVWNPVPGLAWNMDARAAYEMLQNGKMAYGAITLPDGAGTISISDARLLWDSPADVTLTFASGRLSAIRAVVKQPPALVEAVADYEKRFGPAAEKTLARQEEVSRIRWIVKQAGGTLEIVMTEAQGTLTVLYQTAGQ